MVRFPPLAGRRHQSVSFWQSKMADVVAPRPLVRCADVVPSVRPRRDDVDPSVRPHAVAVVPSVRSRRAVVDPSVRSRRAVVFPVSAMSVSQLQCFDSTSSCSYSQSFFSSPVPGVVSSSRSLLDSISPRPQAAVVPVSAFPLVRTPSSAPMVEIHIEFILDVPEIPPSHSIGVGA